MKFRLILIILLFGITFVWAEDLLLDVLFSNDIHGGIDRYEATFMNPDFPPMLGGGGSAATYINNVRELSDGNLRDNLLVDAGDFFQGHPVGTITQGRAVIKYFNMIGYDLSVVGNHEFDLGEDVLIETYKLAEFPILSCNIIRKGTNELVEYVQPYIILEKMGVKIGIIGVTTTDTDKMSFPDNIKNVEFLPAKESLEKYVKIVRDEGVDLLFVVGHMGLPYYPEPVYRSRYIDKPETTVERNWGYDAQELAHEVEGIDVFFGGHIHKGFPEPWEDPLTHTLVLQGYAYGSNIGHITFKIDKETKTLSGYEVPAIKEGVMVTLFDDEFIPDEEIADTILVMQKIAEAGMDKIIGDAAINITKSGTGPQNMIGNMVCEAILDYTGADFSFMNLGGIRDELLAGPISYRDVFNVMPFDNQVVMFEVDGKFLKDIIETRVNGSRHGLRVAGVQVVINRKRSNFDRVTKLIIGGEPWDADKTYQIATTDFLLQGNAGLALLTKIPESQITRYEQDLRDVIIEYIKKYSPVTTRIDNRWKRDDKSELSPELERVKNNQ
jgi:2',3'-cyclic-nucleotide 2'-phosphodiesterase (5'-nucleotidase family)